MPKIKAITPNFKTVAPRTSPARNKWTPQEHQALQEAVEELCGGQINENNEGLWIQVAKRVTSRSAKQCRSRWLNNGKTGIKKGGWDHLEELIICSQHALEGSCWSKLSALLKDRTENGLKNRWTSLYNSKTMVRPFSVLWQYIQQLKKRVAPVRAFKAAVGEWQDMVPKDLAVSMLQQFRMWQDENQPRSIAVRAETPAVISSTPQADWNFYLPDADCDPRAIQMIRQAQNAAPATPPSSGTSMDDHQHLAAPQLVDGHPQQHSKTTSIPVPAESFTMFFPAQEQPAAVHVGGSYPHATTHFSEPAGLNGNVFYLCPAAQPVPAPDPNPTVSYILLDRSAGQTNACYTNMVPLNNGAAYSASPAAIPPRACMHAAVTLPEQPLYRQVGGLPPGSSLTLTSTDHQIHGIWPQQSTQSTRPWVLTTGAHAPAPTSNPSQLHNVRYLMSRVHSDGTPQLTGAYLPPPPPCRLPVYQH